MRSIRREALPGNGNLVPRHLMRLGDLPRGLVLSLTLALVGLAVPSAASAQSHDFVTTIDNVSSPGANVREARITVENAGPDDFIACHEAPEDCYRSTNWQYNAHIAIQIDASPDNVRTANVTTSVPCEQAYFGSPGTMVCNFGDSLPVGSSISVDVAFPAGQKGGEPDGLSGGVNWHEYGSAGGGTLPEDPNALNSGDFYSWGDEGSCELQAKGPQKANKALVVTVFGGTSGCAAKLTAAKLKIGNKVYTFIKKKPAKDVAPGEKWKVSIPIKGQTLTTVNKALTAKKNVKAKAEFKLGDRSDSIVVKLK